MQRLVLILTSLCLTSAAEAARTRTTVGSVPGATPTAPTRECRSRSWERRGAIGGTERTIFTTTQHRVSRNKRASFSEVLSAYYAIGNSRSPLQSSQLRSAFERLIGTRASVKDVDKQVNLDRPERARQRLEQTSRRRIALRDGVITLTNSHLWGLAPLSEVELQQGRVIP